MRRGRVVIGARQVLGAVGFPDLLAQFHTAHPGVEVLRSGLIAQLLTALDAGDVDVVLGPLHPGPALASRGIGLSRQTVDGQANG